jgi:hypothetical protein
MIALSVCFIFMGAYLMGIAAGTIAARRPPLVLVRRIER